MSLPKRFIHPILNFVKNRRKTASLFSIAFLCLFYFFLHPLFPFITGAHVPKTVSMPLGDIFQEDSSLEMHTDSSCTELTYEPVRELEPPKPAVILPKVGETGEPLWEESLVDKLHFLSTPIPGAKITTRNSQLPGAPRPYRNGTHQGLDYYDGFCGVRVRFGDPVYAAGGGVIYRIDHGYSEPDPVARQEILRVSHSQEDTPEHILDILRGRQVWIKHKYSVITRYAHLHEVAEHLNEGDPVETGDYIGSVGNSGTSDGARGNTLNAHLHFEIWLGDFYLGQGLAPAEIRKLWQTVLDQH